MIDSCYLLWQGVTIQILSGRLQFFWETSNPPSGWRRLCAVQAFCHRQNLGAGRIHFARAFQSPKGGATNGSETQKKMRLVETSRIFFWSRWGESNPRVQLGKLTFCHWTTPATWLLDYYNIGEKKMQAKFSSQYGRRRRAGNGIPWERGLMRERALYTLWGYFLSEIVEFTWKLVFFLLC